eukprot:scaffold78160_cov37-Cyclotella_meneghiniana.AAC.1
MAMVEAPGGSAVGRRSNHGRRTTPFFLEGRLEKAERRAGSGKNKSPQMVRPPYSTTHFLDRGCAPISGVAARAHGVSVKSTRLMLQTMQCMDYFIKTGFGISDQPAFGGSA